MNKLLEKIYYNVQTGYNSLNELYKRAKVIKPTITVQDVKVWLEKQPTYTLHKPAKKKYPRNRVWLAELMNSGNAI